MKVIIEHSQTKRQICGSFNICGSKEDLSSIAEQLLMGLDSPMVYGWIHINSKAQNNLINQTPIGWD